MKFIEKKSCQFVKFVDNKTAFAFCVSHFAKNSIPLHFNKFLNNVEQ